MTLKKSDEFVNKMLSLNFNYIENDWYNLSQEEKQEVRQLIKKLETKDKNSLKMYLNIVNEFIAKEIFIENEQKETLKYELNEFKINIAGNLLTGKEIRDKCLSDIKFVPDFLLGFRTLNSSDRIKILEEFKSIDHYFFNAIIFSLRTFFQKLNIKDEYIEEEFKNLSLNEKKVMEQRIETESQFEIEPKIDIKYYLESKAKSLKEYKKLLKESGLGFFEIKKLIEIEAQNLTINEFDLFLNIGD